MKYTLKGAGCEYVFSLLFDIEGLGDPDWGNALFAIVGRIGNEEHRTIAG